MILFPLPSIWMYNGNRNKSNSFDPNYIPVELSFDSDEDHEYEAEQAWKRDAPKRRLQEAISSRKAYYLELRQKNKLTHARAVAAADPEELYYKNRVNMPAKKTYPKKTPGKGIAKKPTAKPGTKSNPIDINKLVKAATERALSKNIETQHSYARITLEPQTIEQPQPDGTVATVPKYVGSGVSMSPLNLSSDGKFSTTNCLAFNLSSLAQVRGSTSNGGAASGWRNGYKIHVTSISVDVRIVVVNPSIDAKFFAWICRKKDGVRTDFAVPSIQSMEKTQLFREKLGGPFSVSGLDVDFHTVNKKNTEVWSWPEGMRDEKSISAATRANTGRTVHLNIYKKMDTVWEFSTDTANANPALKDGDYHLFVFREGVSDVPALKTETSVNIDLGFKDC